MKEINLTPTWGEVGNVLWRMIESNEQQALKLIRSEFARAMAAAEALKVLMDTPLTEEQKKLVSETLETELKKQGY